MRSRLLAGVPALLLLASLSACSDDPDEKAQDDTTSEDNSDAPSGSPTATVTDSDATSAPAGVSCEYTPDGMSSDVTPPPDDAVYSGQVQATIATSAGDLAVTLDADKAPCTVNSFLTLAEQGYFDDTPCHRLTSYPTLSVLQCGDPTGQGTGGPGYTIPDELETAGDYSAGVLAMANTGQPDSGGSQFFIVYADSDLPPSYTIFGTIDQASIDAVAKVAADGSTPESDGAPNTPVEITGVTAS